MPRSVNHVWLMRQSPQAIRSSIQRYYRLNGTEPEAAVRVLREEAIAERRRFQEIARDPDYSVVLASDRRYAAISIAELQSAINALSEVIRAMGRAHMAPSRTGPNRRGAAVPRRRYMFDQDEPSFGDDDALRRNRMLREDIAVAGRFAPYQQRAREARLGALDYQALAFMGLGSARDFRNAEIEVSRRRGVRREDREETPEYEPGPNNPTVDYWARNR